MPLYSLFLCSSHLWTALLTHSSKSWLLCLNLYTKHRQFPSGWKKGNRKEKGKSRPPAVIRGAYVDLSCCLGFGEGSIPPIADDWFGRQTGTGLQHKALWRWLSTRAPGFIVDGLFTIGPGSEHVWLSDFSCWFWNPRCLC